MEELFGSTLWRWREIPEDEMLDYQEQLDARKANEEQADQVQEETAGGFRVSPQQQETKAEGLKNTDIQLTTAEQADLPQEPMPWEDVAFEEVFEPSIKYVGVLFSAAYCPPCHGFLQPLQEFYQEFNKTGKVLELVWVSCDKSVQEFKAHFAEMQWVTAVAFDNQESLHKLEELCKAETIPKLSVINRQKAGGTEVSLLDVKRLIVKKQQMKDAVEEVMQEIINNF